MQISLKNVSYTYNYKTPYAREVLKDINLNVEEGSYTVIIGKTGSGKSTLIEHINGLLLPTYGEVLVNNVLITNPKSKKEKPFWNKGGPYFLNCKGGPYTFYIIYLI